MNIIVNSRHLAGYFNFLEYLGRMLQHCICPKTIEFRNILLTCVFCLLITRSGLGQVTGASRVNKALIAQLDTIWQDDQQVRIRMEEELTKVGTSSKELSALSKTMHVKDSINLVKVKCILDKHGWLGPKEVGKIGNETLFAVIQHADIKTQEKYIPMLRDAVNKNRATKSSLALMEDRIALRRGGKQIYGSQVMTDGQGTFLSPLQDPDHVDERRAAVGLKPIAEYLREYNMKWDVEEYKKQLPGIEKRQQNIYD